VTDVGTTPFNSPGPVMPHLGAIHGSSAFMCRRTVIDELDDLEIRLARPFVEALPERCRGDRLLHGGDARPSRDSLGLESPA
jgi:hypothetical protein